MVSNESSVGDQVTAYDPSSGTTSAQTVQHVWINHDTDLIDLTLRTEAPAHPAQDPHKSRQVLAGEPLGRAPPQDKTASSTTQQQSQDEVVHTTVKHPFLTVEQGWVPAGQLTQGMHVVREDGSTAVVIRERVVPGAASMWNLTVSNLHTYAVGAGQFVVHNCPDGEGGAAGGSGSGAGGPSPSAQTVPDDTVIVLGGTKDVPPAGEVFSGAQGGTVEEAAAGVPHGQIRTTTAGDIRAGGGEVTYNPEYNPSAGRINYQHVDVTLGEGSDPFSDLMPNPVPKGGRIGGHDYQY